MCGRRGKEVNTDLFNRENLIVLADTLLQPHRECVYHEYRIVLDLFDLHRNFGDYSHHFPIVCAGE